MLIEEILIIDYRGVGKELNKEKNQPEKGLNEKFKKKKKELRRKGFYSGSGTYEERTVL